MLAFARDLLLGLTRNTTGFNKSSKGGVVIGGFGFPLGRESAKILAAHT